MPEPASSPQGFTLLEVLVALSILTIALISIYQAFASSTFLLSSTKNLWAAMVYSHNELTRWERSVNAPLSIAQGKFEEGQALAGASWVREISDVFPFPGLFLQIRKVAYEIQWQEGNNNYSYHAEIFIKPD